jgi:hypothetical protein
VTLAEGMRWWEWVITAAVAWFLVAATVGIAFGRAVAGMAEAFEQLFAGLDHPVPAESKSLAGSSDVAA